MSYKKAYPKTFLNTEFNDPITPYVGVVLPARCPDHQGICFKAENYWNWLDTHGIWKLRVPLKVDDIMPGERQKIISMSASGLYHLGTGTWFECGTRIALLADGVKVFEYSNLTHENMKWASNLFDLNINVENVTELDIEFEQYSLAVTGYFALHDANITLLGEYYTDVPPVTGQIEIKVVDAETELPIPNLEVRLMSGAVVVRTGRTSAAGIIAWSGVDEGNYLLRVTGIAPTYWSGGYSDLDYVVEIVGGELTAYNVSLAPAPRLYVPWYVWGGIGVAAVVGGYVFLRPRIPTSIVQIPLHLGDILKEKIRKRGEE